jgi:hypothetical protein
MSPMRHRALFGNAYPSRNSFRFAREFIHHA